MSQWSRHGLPENISGKTLVDVGCWEGEVCVEAKKRGAAVVLDIDYCTSPDLIDNIEKYQFDFIQLDLLSEKALELPEFDVVHRAGVLYHVENPLSFLFRLRKLCRHGGWLFIETSMYCSSLSEPIMAFHPDNSLDDNPSNWWSPNEECLKEMLRAVGFSDCEVTHKSTPDSTEKPLFGRIAVKVRATSTPHSLSQKLLPRRPSYMANSKGRGNRRGVER